MRENPKSETTENQDKRDKVNGILLRLITRGGGFLLACIGDGVTHRQVF